jgi:hypothetical protein
MLPDRIDKPGRKSPQRSYPIDMIRVLWVQVKRGVAKNANFAKLCPKETHRMLSLGKRHEE